MKLTKLIIITKLIILTLFIQGCSVPQKKQTVDLDEAGILFENMSIAIKTLYLAGVSNGFSDIDQNLGSGSPSVINTAGTVGYFTGVLNPIQGPSFGLSSSTMGWLSLTQGLADKRTPSDKLDRRLMAYIPKSIAKTEMDAKLLMAESMANAIARMDRLDNVKYEVMTINYDNVPNIDFRQVLIKTDRKLFYDGDENVTQGSLRYKRPARLLYMNAAKLKSVKQTPYSNQESWLLTTKLHLTQYSEISKHAISIEYVDLAKQLPEWCFIFKLIDNVPVVLNQDKAHLFVKPTNLKAAHNSSASSP